MISGRVLECLLKGNFVLLYEKFIFGSKKIIIMFFDFDEFLFKVEFGD